MLQYLTQLWQYFRRHRMQALALVLFLAVLVAIHTWWLRPLMDESLDLTERIGREQGLIAKYQEKLEQAKELGSQLEDQEKELKRIQERLVQGKDPYQLAAALGELAVGKKTEDLTLKSYQVLNTVEYGLYREVRLQFILSANISGFYQFLAGLESSREAISVQELNVQQRRVRQGPDLSVTVVVAALMEKPKAGGNK